MRKVEMKITGFLKHLPAYQVLIYTLVVLIFLFTIVPFCWLIISSISIKTELLSVPPPLDTEESNFKKLQGDIIWGNQDHQGSSLL